MYNSIKRDGYNKCNSKWDGLPAMPCQMGFQDGLLVYYYIFLCHSSYVFQNIICTFADNHTFGQGSIDVFIEKKTVWYFFYIFPTLVSHSSHSQPLALTYTFSLIMWLRLLLFEQIHRFTCTCKVIRCLHLTKWT